MQLEVQANLNKIKEEKQRLEREKQKSIESLKALETISIKHDPYFQEIKIEQPKVKKNDSMFKKNQNYISSKQFVKN